MYQEFTYVISNITIYKIHLEMSYIRQVLYTKILKLSNLINLTPEVQFLPNAYQMDIVFQNHAVLAETRVKEAGNCGKP